jgi:uncharacterized membrane protein YhhN
VTAPSIVLFAAAAFLAVGDWVARLRRDSRLEYICKPATLLALIGVAVVLSPGPDVGAKRWWFVGALALSVLGDVLLMIPADLFEAGLAAFLLAHLAYLAGFWVRGPSRLALVVAGIAVIVMVVPFGVRILMGLKEDPKLRGPVALYMVVIGAMFATALATGNTVAGIGAGLFVASDTMIAWNRFVRPFRAADVGIMVTYHLGQAGLVLSLLR